jgi:hypothetical protein
MPIYFPTSYLPVSHVRTFVYPRKETDMPIHKVFASLPISKKLLLLLVFVCLCAGGVIGLLGFQQRAKGDRRGKKEYRAAC